MGTFLPAAPQMVRAIAMLGATDDELAFMFGYSPDVIKGWRKMYTDFDEALEEGRTVADLQVVQALHKKAVGYEQTKDVPIKVKTGRFTEAVEMHTITEQIQPDTQSIKYWLSNRNPAQWNKAAKHVQLTGKKDEPPVGFGVKQESKLELMNSILGLIQPKPDGV